MAEKGYNIPMQIHLLKWCDIYIIAYLFVFFNKNEDIFSN